MCVLCQQQKAIITVAYVICDVADDFGIAGVLVPPGQSPLLWPVVAVEDLLDTNNELFRSYSNISKELRSFTAEKKKKFHCTDTGGR